jgi:proteasome lid subunit RPN8/RPN11
MPNVAASDTRFHVDERAHIELRRKLRRLEPPLEIVGVYHSHPAGPPVPSPTDLAEAHYPEWIYVIVGLGRPRAAVRMWSIVGGRADEVG